MVRVIEVKAEVALGAQLAKAVHMPNRNAPQRDQTHIKAGMSR